MPLWTEVVGPMGTNCYIVSGETGNECVVIDPGGNAGRIMEIINRENLVVRYIFLTHGHFDHVLAADTLREKTGALCVIHEDDAESLVNPPPFFKMAIPMKPADITVRTGQCFEVGDRSFIWLHTPGHTKGSCCILTGDCIFTGDTLFEGDCGNTSFPGGDYADMLRSLRMLASLEGDYRVYPGHDVSTTLECERRHNVNMLEALNSNEADN